MLFLVELLHEVASDALLKIPLTTHPYSDFFLNFVLLSQYNFEVSIVHLCVTGINHLMWNYIMHVILIEMFESYNHILSQYCFLNSTHCFGNILIYSNMITIGICAALQHNTEALEDNMFTLREVSVSFLSYSIEILRLCCDYDGFNLNKKNLFGNFASL